jgi:hypothetical protein
MNSKASRGWGRTALDTMNALMNSIYISVTIIDQHSKDLKVKHLEIGMWDCGT